MEPTYYSKRSTREQGYRYESNHCHYDGLTSYEQLGDAYESSHETTQGASAATSCYVRVHILDDPPATDDNTHGYILDAPTDACGYICGRTQGVQPGKPSDDTGYCNILVESLWFAVAVLYHR